jgi:hypothetical protein
MRTIAHKSDDVVRISEEILTFRPWALTISTSIKHQQAEPLIGERSLRLPFLSARRKRPVHKNHRRASAPGVYEKVGHFSTLALEAHKMVLRSRVRSVMRPNARVNRPAATENRKKNCASGGSG